MSPQRQRLPDWERLLAAEGGRLHRLRQTIPDVKSVEDNAKELDAIYRAATD